MGNKLLYAIIAILLAVITLQVVVLIKTSGTSENKTYNTDNIKELANTLLNKELYQQAITEYLNYLDKARDLDAAKRTNILYMIANTYHDKVKDYENALAYYYRAKFYEPQGELLKEINKKIVSCLEKLERSLDAKNELDNAALYVEEGGEKKEDKSQVIAKIDEKMITMQDLESEIEKLPPNMQAEYNTPENKLEILKQMVSTELFYRAAQRLGLDKDKEVIAKTFEIKKSLMAQKYLMDELKDKMKIEPQDLNLYYEANKERYKTPKKALVRMMSFKEKEKADSAKQKLDKGGNFAEVAKKESEDAKSAENGGLLGEIPYGTPVPGFKDYKKFYETVFALPENKISKVEHIDDAFYIFKVDKYISGVERSINEVFEQVKEDVFRDKEFAEGMKLMERLGKTHDVKIFEDVVLGLQSK